MFSKLQAYQWKDDSGLLDSGHAEIMPDGRINLKLELDDVSAYHLLHAPKARALGEWLIKAADQLEGKR